MHTTRVGTLDISMEEGDAKPSLPPKHNGHAHHKGGYIGHFYGGGRRQAFSPPQTQRSCTPQGWVHWTFLWRRATPSLLSPPNTTVMHTTRVGTLDISMEEGDAKPSLPPKHNGH